MPKTVRPYNFSGWNKTLLSLFGKGPKLTITCGACRATFKQRVPYRVKHPGMTCPTCNVVNILPIEWKNA